MGIQSLPEEVLAMVFSSLDTEELLREVRAVCRRWRKAALHPVAWRHRHCNAGIWSESLEPEEVALAERVLATAPCLRFLSVSTSALNEEPRLQQALLESSCKVQEIFVHAREQCAALVDVVWLLLFSDTVRRLGLEMKFVNEESVALLKTIGDAHLDHLHVRDVSQPDPEDVQLLESLDGCWGSGSVTDVSYQGLFYESSVLNLILASQSSLESVTYWNISLEGDLSLSAPWVSRLAGCPKLIMATLPLVVEVASLTACGGLGSLQLWDSPDEPRSAEQCAILTPAIAGYLSSATQLRRLTLGTLRDGEMVKDMFLDLVAALAASGCAQLQHLELFTDLEPAGLTARLTTLLPGLPELRRLSLLVGLKQELDADTLCSLIEAAPSLSMLELVYHYALDLLTDCPLISMQSLNVVIDSVRSHPNMHVRVCPVGEMRDILNREYSPNPMGFYDHPPSLECTLHDEVPANWLCVCK